MKRILLAVITEADVCSASFCVSLAQSAKVGLMNDVEFFPVFLPANGNWSMAFNQAVTLMWTEKLDGFLCVSPRVSWQPEFLLTLTHSDKDAVAIPVATRNGFEVSLGEVARLQEDTESGEIKVRGASLDFIYLSSYAVEQLCTTHPTINYKGQEVKLVLQHGDIYDSYFSPGDILAYRLREQGIELWLSTKHTAHRQDAIEYSNDFASVLENLKANE
jgi:hypothetical protein